MLLKEINGSQSWLRQLEQMRRIDKTELGVSFVGGIRILYIEDRVFIGLRRLWQHFADLLPCVVSLAAYNQSAKSIRWQAS